MPATFLRRINRFTAEVLVGGQPEIAHVKNTGRLGELLVPDAPTERGVKHLKELAAAAKAGWHFTIKEGG